MTRSGTSDLWGPLPETLIFRVSEGDSWLVSARRQLLLQPYLLWSLHPALLTLMKIITAFQQALRGA